MTRFPGFDEKCFVVLVIQVVVIVLLAGALLTWLFGWKAMLGVFAFIAFIHFALWATS